MDTVLLIKAAIMGIVEGLTEFLPISSTGHLILAGSLLGGFEDARGKVFDIAIQTGAILAVIIVYWQRLRETAAGNVDRLAESVQAAASRLAQDDVGHMSQYISNLADGMGRLSGSLRDKSGDELLREVGRLARENPALFVTGSIAIGFGLGRFARASQRPSQSGQLDDSGTNADGTSTWSSQPATAGMPASGLGSSTGPAMGTGAAAAGATAAPSGGTGSIGTGGIGTGGSHQGTPGNPGSAGLPGGTPTGTRGGTH